MKKQLISLGLVATLSSSLLAYTYEIKEGWQLLGAVENITDLSVFNDTCVDYLWKYDTNDTTNSIWRLHIANGIDYNYCGDTLDKLNQGDGFWVKANASCSITVGSTCDTLSDIPTPENIEDNCSTCDTNVGGDSNSSGGTTGGTVSHNGFTYGTVVSPYTGKTWLDRNLGASQVCTSMTDEACYGDYYQWGREADGHEKLNSSSSTTQVADIKNIGSDFIHGNIGDWTTSDIDGTIRQANWAKTDGTSICPVGFRVPIEDEILNETVNQNIISYLAIFNDFLKIPKASYISYSNGDKANSDIIRLWSNTLNYTPNMYAVRLQISPQNSSTHQHFKSFGHSVRCIKD